MADIRINQLPAENSPVASEVVAIDGATTRKTTLEKLVAAGRPLASQAEAEAGVQSTKAMTPLTTAQAIAAAAGDSFTKAQNAVSFVSQTLAAGQQDQAQANIRGVINYATAAALAAATVPVAATTIELAERLSGNGGGGLWDRTTQPEGAGEIPNAEYNTDFWVFDAQATTRWSFVSNPQAIAPDKRALRSSGADFDASVGVAYQRAVLTEYYPVTVGKTYTYRGTIDATLSPTPKGTAQARVYWYTSANVFISSSEMFSYDIASTGVAQNFSGTVTPPATAVYARIACLHNRNGSNIIGGTVDFYNFALEEAGVVYPAFTQDASGAWFQLRRPTTGVVTIQMFGATLSGTQSPTDRRSAIQAAIDYGALNGVSVYFPPGLWVIASALKFRTGGVYQCAGIDRTIFKLSDTAADAENCWESYTRNSTTTNVRFIGGFTCDGNYARSGVIPSTARPQASCFVTSSARWVFIDEIKVVGGKLHGLDICNGGEGGTDYTNTHTGTYYPANESQYVFINKVIADNCGDDGVTAHYSRYIWINEVLVLGTGQRHSNPNASNATEFDDGCRDIYIDRIVTFGGNGGVVFKMHNPNPAPNNIVVNSIDVTGARTGVWIYGSGSTPIAANVSIGKIIVRNPAVVNVSSTQNFRGVDIGAVTDVSIGSINLVAAGNESITFEEGVLVSTGSKRVSIGSINSVNWLYSNNSSRTGVLHITSSVVSCHVSSVNATNCGYRCVVDTGATRIDVGSIFADNPSLITNSAILDTFSDPKVKRSSYGNTQGSNFAYVVSLGTAYDSAVGHSYFPNTIKVAGGVISGTMTIADDAVSRILPDRIGGMLFLNCMGGSGGTFPTAANSGCGYFDVGVTPSSSIMFGGANFAVSALVLTGTTGTDGKVTMGVDPATGEIIIENRLGVTQSFNYMLLA